VRNLAKRLKIAAHFGEQPVKPAAIDLTGPSSAAIAKKTRSRRTALDQTERPENSRNPRSRSASSGQTGKSDVNSLAKKRLGSQPFWATPPRAAVHVFKNEHQKAVRVVLERKKRSKWQRQFPMQPGQYQKHPKFTKFFRMCAAVDHPGDLKYNTPALDELYKTATPIFSELLGRGHTNEKDGSQIPTLPSDWADLLFPANGQKPDVKQLLNWSNSGGDPG
jgi:hypothetical protein